MRFDVFKADEGLLSEVCWVASGTTGRDRLGELATGPSMGQSSGTGRHRQSTVTHAVSALFISLMMTGRWSPKSS